MGSRERATPSGRRGSRVTIKTSDGQEVELQKKDEVIPMDKPTNEPLASVGFSATIGQSTEYAREKIEVSAWCTLPCPTTEDAITETYQYCYDFVTNELERRSDEAIDKFFPHLKDG